MSMEFLVLGRGIFFWYWGGGGANFVCSKLEPFCETKFGEFCRKFGKIWRILAEILVNFAGISLRQVNLGYFG